nr:hypothetical protein [Desulforamulus aquiferis]
MDGNQNSSEEYRKVRTVVKSSFGPLCCDSYRTILKVHFCQAVVIWKRCPAAPNSLVYPNNIYAGWSPYP